MRGTYISEQQSTRPQVLKRSETMRNEKKDPEGKNKGRSDSIATFVRLTTGTPTSPRQQVTEVRYKYLFFSSHN